MSLTYRGHQRKIGDWLVGLSFGCATLLFHRIDRDCLEFFFTADCRVRAGWQEDLKGGVLKGRVGGGIK